MDAIQIALLSCVLSLIPTLMWAAIFLYKHQEKHIFLIKTYVYGALMVVPLIAYRYFFQIFESPTILFGIISSSVLVLFLTVGFLEEYLKHLVTKVVDQKEIQSIDDAMEFSIVAALGFAFAENTFYFIEVYQSLGKAVFYQAIVLRSLFATFAHVFFSCIYGYYYGRELFAEQLYSSIPADDTQKRLTKRIAKILNCLHPKQVFKKQMRLYGLLLAALTHTMYNVLLELDIVNFLIPFIGIGFYIVLKLIWSRKNQIKYQVSK